MPEGEPDRGLPGFAVFPLALQIPEQFRSVGVVKMLQQVVLPMMRFI